MKTRMKMHETRNNLNTFTDASGQYVVTSAAQVQPTNNMKRPLSLDLNAAANNNRFVNKKLAVASIVLSTPDVNMMTMNTPDIERFIVSNMGTLPIPTPNTLNATNLFKATDEQQEFARGFTEALKNIREQNQQNQDNNNVNEFPMKSGAILHPAIVATSTSAPTTNVLSTVGMSGGSVTYTNLDNSYPVTIKHEPHTVPNSPPMSPIDMNNQEKIKLERKRQRNRVAASKCRKKKLERISKLEDKVKILRGENAELNAVKKSIREHISQLKQQVMHHANSGCNMSLYSVAI